MTKPAFTSPVQIAVGASLIAVGIAAAAMMLKPPPPPPPRRPVQLIVGFDTSRGDRPHLADAATRGARLAADRDPDIDSVVLYRVDYDTRAVYDADAPSSADSITETLNRELKPLPVRDGTRPAEFFSEAARRAAATTGDTVLCYISDADSDDQSKRAVAELRKAGSDLAANPRVRCVIFADVSPENRAWIARQFGPLGDRLHVFGVTDGDGETLTETVEKALIGHSSRKEIDRK